MANFDISNSAGYAQLYDGFEYPTLAGMDARGGTPAFTNNRALPPKLAGRLAASTLDIPVTKAAERAAVQPLLDYMQASMEGNPAAYGLRQDAVEALKVVRKDFISNPIVGAQANIFDVCERIEFGYGIYANPLDYANALINFFDPVIVNDWREWEFSVMDYSQVFGNTQGPYDVQDILCGNVNIPTSQGTIGRCKIKYCADFHRAVGTAVGTLQLEDFMRRCYEEPPINLYGLVTKDPAQVQERIMLESMKRDMIKESLNGSWVAGKGTGIFNFHDEYALRHPELANDCSDLLPKDVVVNATCPSPTPATTAAEIRTYYYNVALAIEKALVESEQRVSYLGPGATIPENYRLFMMRWEDAMCFQWMQACMRHCRNIVYNINMDNYGELAAQQEAAQQDFINRMKRGKYGAGQIYLPSGRIIDVFAFPQWDELMPKGFMYLWQKGWTGGYNPTTYAMRPMAPRWDRALEYYRSKSPIVAQTMIPMMNGTGFMVLPTKACDNKAMVWSPPDFGFSNAAWLQYRFELPANCSCSEIYADARWAGMPPIAPPTRCAPANIS